MGLAPEGTLLREGRTVNIFSTAAIEDSALQPRPRFLASDPCFQGNCRTTAYLSLSTGDLPPAQVVHRLILGESEAV
jgi:hypothetical protein